MGEGNETRSGVGQIDPLVLQDLRAVEHCCTVLRGYQIAILFWEAFTLIKSNRELVLAEVARLGRSEDRKKRLVNEELLDRLSEIQEKIGPLAEQLREYLLKHPMKMDHTSLDLAMVFILSAARGREAAARWVADPAGQAAESGLRLRVMSRIVDAYRKALIQSHVDNVPAIFPPPDAPIEEPVAPVPAPAPAATPIPQAPAAPTPAPVTAPIPETPAAAPVPPPGMPAPNKVFLENLRAADVMRRTLAELEPVEVWEVLLLLGGDRKAMFEQLNELSGLKRRGDKGAFAGAAYRLREQLREVRAQHGGFARALLAYLVKLFGVWVGETEEIAFAMLMSSAQGRHRVRQWLEDQDLCREEAFRTVKGLLPRASSYREALEQATHRHTSAS